MSYRMTFDSKRWNDKMLMFQMFDPSAPSETHCVDECGHRWFRQQCVALRSKVIIWTNVDVYADITLNHLRWKLSRLSDDSWSVPECVDSICTVILVQDHAFTLTVKPGTKTERQHMEIDQWEIVLLMPVRRLNVCSSDNSVAHLICINIP